jgi:hypothetical protein
MATGTASLIVGRRDVRGIFLVQANFKGRSIHRTSQYLSNWRPTWLDVPITLKLKRWCNPLDAGFGCATPETMYGVTTSLFCLVLQMLQ